jgi:AcrR family transcriptional regulator
MAKAARKPRGDTSTGPGPTPARATRITRTRPVLCGALLSLLEDRPFEQLTVREITAKADIGYATFFRHYPDKESLLNDLAAFQISELLSMALPILYAANTRASARALCIYVWEHRKLWSTLLTGGAAGTLRDEFIRQAHQIAETRPNPGVWLPGDLLVVFSVTGTVEILAWWLKQAAPPSIDQMAEVLDCLVVAPSMRRSGSRRPLKPPK